MEQNDKEYAKFIKWLSDKNTDGLTLSEVSFAKQFFELLEDYPSFKNKLTSTGSKINVFTKIQFFLKE